MYSVMIMYDMGAEYRLPYDYDAGKYDHLYPFVFDSLSFCLEGVKTGGMGFKTLRIEGGVNTWEFCIEMFV